MLRLSQYNWLIMLFTVDFGLGGVSASVTQEGRWRGASSSTSHSSCRGLHVVLNSIPVANSQCKIFIGVVPRSDRSNASYKTR